MRALVLIGSVAEGGFCPESDIDLLCVKKGKTPWEEQRKIHEPLDSLVQLIFFDEATFNFHFEKRTTMAHSIKKGIVLYEVEEFVSNILSKEMGPPDKEWMKNWTLHWLRFYQYGVDDIERSKEWHQKYCDEECICHINDIIARVVVNFSILFLETHGIVPTTKSQIQRHFEMKINDEKLVAGMRLALIISRQGRYLSYEEALSVAHVAKKLRTELISNLGLTCEDLMSKE